MSAEEELLQCELCGRRVAFVTKHHLIPKQKGGRGTPTVNLCQPCHTTLHHTFTNKELAKQFNTIEKLKASGRVSEYLEWIKDRPLEKLSFKGSRRK